MTIQERIEELQEARKMRILWQERENFLSRPIVQDLTMIDELWRRAFVNKPNVRQRKAFVFVVLYFFSPSKLAGGKIIRQVMQKLSRITGCTKSVLSHNCDDVVMHYHLYRDFRQRVKKVADVLVELLMEKGYSEDDFLCIYEIGQET